MRPQLPAYAQKFARKEAGRYSLRSGHTPLDIKLSSALKTAPPSKQQRAVLVYKLSFGNTLSRATYFFTLTLILRVLVSSFFGTTIFRTPFLYSATAFSPLTEVGNFTIRSNEPRLISLL
jgi:hypothetical protein